MYGAGFDTGPAVPGAMNEGLAALCTVLDQETLENASLGTPPGAAQPGAGQDATPHGPAGGQGGTDNREWPSPASLNPDKLAAAQQLKKDNSLWTSVKLTGWKPTKTKPTKTELWQVIMERDPKARPKAWSLDKMMEHLLAWTGPVPDQEPPATGGPAPAPEESESPPEPDGAGERPPEPDGAGVRWSKHKAARLICICVDSTLREDFLNRDRKLSLKCETLLT